MKRAVILAALLAAAPLLADSTMPASAYANVQLEDPAQEVKAEALMESLRCLQCQGQSIADSDAQIAGDLRRRQVHGGLVPVEAVETLSIGMSNTLTLGIDVGPQHFPGV